MHALQRDPVNTVTWRPSPFDPVAMAMLRNVQTLLAIAVIPMEEVAQLTAKAVVFPVVSRDFARLRFRGVHR